MKLQFEQILNNVIIIAVSEEIYIIIFHLHFLFRSLFNYTVNF